MQFSSPPPPPAPWSDVAPAQWNDWKWQLRNRITKLEQVKDLMRLTPEEEEGFKAAPGKLAIGITPYYFALMDLNDPACPIRRQVMPNILEIETNEYESADPLGEDQHMAVPGLVHRYPDRVLLLATGHCASYCRYCTRSRIVGESEGTATTRDGMEVALDYIRSNRKIRDVLLSGGDPLTLSNDRLEAYLAGVRSIPHVEFLRIGTRVPCFLPQRITDDLVNMLKKYHPLFMSVHFSHPKEVTPEAKAALAKLADAGIPLGSQTVLMRGINDRASVMKKLMHEMLMARVKPYYIYQADPVAGTAHFRTPVSVGINIMEKLRGHTTGYAVPTFVVDAPGGGGKIPVAPNYLFSQGRNMVLLRNYENKVYEYHEPGKSRKRVKRKEQVQQELPIEEKVPTTASSNTDTVPV